MQYFTRKFVPGDKVVAVSENIEYSPKKRFVRRNDNKVWTIRGEHKKAYLLEGDNLYRWFENELDFAEKNVCNREQLLNDVL